MAEFIPEKSKRALCPILDTIKELSTKIADYDDLIEKQIEKKYPQAERLSQVKGVGSLTSLAFVLIIADPSRFPKKRNVGAYIGLVPGKWESGENDPQLRISKAGDKFLRRLSDNEIEIPSEEQIGPIISPEEGKPNQEETSEQRVEEEKKDE